MNNRMQLGDCHLYLLRQLSERISSGVPSPTFLPGSRLALGSLSTQVIRPVANQSSQMKFGAWLASKKQNQNKTKRQNNNNKNLFQGSLFKLPDVLFLSF